MQYFIVPEPENRIAVFVQPFITNSVMFGIAMLRSIQFNNQPFFTAQKINDVRTKRHLPRELVAIQPAIAQFTPKPVFRLGVTGAQRARIRCGLSFSF